MAKRKQEPGLSECGLCKKAIEPGVPAAVIALGTVHRSCADANVAKSLAGIEAARKAGTHGPARQYCAIGGHWCRSIYLFTLTGDPVCFTCAMSKGGGVGILSERELVSYANANPIETADPQFSARCLAELKRRAEVKRVRDAFNALPIPRRA